MSLFPPTPDQIPAFVSYVQMGPETLEAQQLGTLFSIFNNWDLKEDKWNSPHKGWEQNPNNCLCRSGPSTEELLSEPQSLKDSGSDVKFQATGHMNVLSPSSLIALSDRYWRTEARHGKVDYSSADKGKNQPLIRHCMGQKVLLKYTSRQESKSKRGNFVLSKTDLQFFLLG
jgi:hypothetical protein